MKKVKMLVGTGLLFLVMIGSTGCSSELKYLAINQVVGLASQVTSALATSAINSIIAGSSTTTQ